MGISGLWGAYLTESAERRRDLVELGRYTLSDLSETRIGEASRFAVIVVAIVDGIAPALAAAIILIPFLLIGVLSSIRVAYIASLGVALITLFALGVFLGHISRQNWALYGLRTLVAGVISILVSFLLGAGEAG
jgi:predicted membrane protein (TIGR00267 family)